MITSLSVERGGLGRFGNQLFTIAGTIGIAIKNGQSFAFPKWINRDAALFGGNADEMSQYFVNPLPELPENLGFQDIPYHWDYRDYNYPTGNWNICSHLQSERYFKHCIETVRHYFTMKDESPMNAIALHWRAGDYIADENAYHPRCSKEYYEQALSLLPQDMKVMVFSDDLDGAMKFLPQTDRFYYARRDKHYMMDFKLMKQCTHFICANSSFSHMAALLGTHPEKKIVMPRRWFGTQAGITMQGQYPDSAIII